MPVSTTCGSGWVARSAKTGKFVSKSYAKTHKSTTELERVRAPKPKK